MNSTTMHDATDENGAADHTIIFVHGRGFKPPEADYLESVVTAMTCGVEQDSREFLDLFASAEDAGLLRRFEQRLPVERR